MLFLVCMVVAGVVLHRSSFGRKVFVIGDNAEVARYSGIDVARTKVVLFTTSALVAGVAGVLFAARLGSVRANIGEGFELDIITMVLLGGVSIFGGSGTLVGVALAICIVLNLRNGLGLATSRPTRRPASSGRCSSCRCWSRTCSTGCRCGGGTWRSDGIYVGADPGEKERER